MISTAPRAHLHCPVGLFRRHEDRVARITTRLYRAPTTGGRTQAAAALLEEVAVLLRCEAHDEASVDCRRCQGYSELRRLTAASVVQATAGRDRRPSPEQAWAA